MTKQLLFDLDSYYNEISNAIICKTKIKTEFITDLKEKVAEFIEENQPTSVDDIIVHFGQPEEIARNFLEAIDPSHIRKSMNWKKVLLTGIILAILMLAIYLTISFLDGHKIATGYAAENPFIEYTIEENGG